ncbi:MAG: 4Fe-4S dicluster domain-containing protein [Candidatus Omnitrophica bacterium]|jgi:ferredoxin-type protein NapG|nr:4Fe-4S dicluster domain-containing protein [Candidatus Omnitrophota bacterium]
MNRKEFLISLAGTILTAASPGLLRYKKKKTNFLRPPGSLEENVFSKSCIRCGECIRACPAKCLKQVKIEESFNDWLTPEIIPRQKGCILCQNCGIVCPTGAIRKVNSEKIKIGTARIFNDMCLVWTNQKECLVCLEFCPAGAIYTDDKGRPIVNPELCVGCGLCEQNCPVTSQDAAIRVSTKGEKRVHLKDGKYY